MELKKLEEFLRTETIPVIKNKIGFLEIIRKQHYENINSNLYAHFLSCGINEIRSLFLDSLLSLISEKANKQLYFTNEKVSTEILTASNGRIDFVIEDFNTQNTIIVENKIYHELRNDLLDYWNHYKIDSSKKVGILLTLYPFKVPDIVEKEFINITHLEWINRIKENYTAEMLTGNYKVYVEDFINTIESLTLTNTMNESAKFYFEHAQQVLKANETLREGQVFLNNQLQEIASKIGWQTFGSDMNWRNFWDENNHLDTYLTIITRNIIEGKLNFRLILELNREDKKRLADVIAVFENHPQAIGNLNGYSKGTYVHFLSKDYTLTIEELANFADVVVAKIKDDFAEITIDVIKYLYPNTDISTFENQFAKSID